MSHCNLEKLSEIVLHVGEGSLVFSVVLFETNSNPSVFLPSLLGTIAPVFRNYLTKKATQMCLVAPFTYSRSMSVVPVNSVVLKAVIFHRMTFSSHNSSQVLLLCSHFTSSSDILADTVPSCILCLAYLIIILQSQFLL